MKDKGQRNAIYLALCTLLAATLACNISTPRGPITPAPETAISVATAGNPQPTNTASAGATSSPPTSESQNSENGSSSGGAGGDSSLPGDDDVNASVSVKNGNESYEGHIAFPGSDTSDEIYIKPVDFDSVKTSGNLVFTLTCSGRGKAKVNYKGGAVTNGKPGCGETWTVSVINGSPDSHITVHLDDSGDINWTLTVTSGE
jgi:hypothetical protein